MSGSYVLAPISLKSRALANSSKMRTHQLFTEAASYLLGVNVAFKLHGRINSVAPHGVVSSIHLFENIHRRYTSCRGNDGKRG